VFSQLHHQETDYLPYTLRFEGDVAERLDAYYGSDAWRGLIDNAIRRFDFTNLGLGESASEHYTDLYGSTWRVDHQIPRLVEPALKTPSLEGLVFPSLDAIFEPGWQEDALRAIEKQGDYFLVAMFGVGVFDRSWWLRGFTEALMDAVAEPDFYAELIEQLADHQLTIIEQLVELSVDGIMFLDDWGYQSGILLGPERWRRFLKPHLARMYARVREAGKVVLTHCCGSVADVMPDLIEIGLDVLQSVQPEAKGMIPYELKRCYGTQITFWGGLGTQSTVPFAKPDEIEAEVAKLCREMGRGGGYILAPSKPLQPDTPTKNAAAVVEAFLQQAGVTF
jgi:uroporphyrinogen decarboxylase